MDEDISVPSLLLPKIVIEAVRAVGVIRPKFNPQERGFDTPKLEVLGTGFWLKEKRSFITCAHVVRKVLDGPIEVTGMLVVGGNNSEYRKAIISMLDFTHDLAVLEVEADDKYLTNQIRTGLDIIERNVDVAERVSYAGFPFGNELLNSKHTPTYAEGVIGTDVLEDTNPKFIQISGSVAGGYSGAPIVLQNDPKKVIAVLANSPSKKAGDASIFRGIHWKHVKELFDLIQS